MDDDDEKCRNYDENKEKEINNIYDLRHLNRDDGEETSFNASIQYMKNNKECWRNYDERIANIRDIDVFNKQGGRLPRRKRKSRSKSKSKKTIKRKRRTKSKTKSKKKTNKTITKRKHIYK